jgi:hypothetical protein
MEERSLNRMKHLVRKTETSHNQETLEDRSLQMCRHGEEAEEDEASFESRKSKSVFPNALVMAQTTT